MEQYNAAKKQYAQYVAEQIKLREENEMWRVGYGMVTGLLEPSAFSDLTAGINFGDVIQKDYRYNAYQEITTPLLDRFRANEITAPTLSYGTKADEKGITHSDNIFYMVDSNKVLSAGGYNTQVDNKKGGNISLDMTQICPQGVYTFSIGTGSNNDFSFNNFRFYSNEEFRYEAEHYKLSLDEIKKRFASGIGYSIHPTTKWIGGQDNNGHPLTSEYSVKLSSEDIYMLANMLFKEGLEKTFEAKKIEIPEIYRVYYEEQAQDNGLNIEAAPVVIIEEEMVQELPQELPQEMPQTPQEEQVEEIDYTTVSDEELMKNINAIEQQVRLLEQLSIRQELTPIQQTTLNLNKEYLEIVKQITEENTMKL